MRQFIALFMLSMLAIVSAHADNNKNGITEYQLKNGMKIIVKEDHRAPTVVSMIWYKVGGADEPGGITGISHALEHMMFKGTLTHPPGAFSKIIASIGGQENAFTNRDYTAYFETLAASKLATSLQLEADRMQNLNLKKEEFIKEIKVVQEERRMRTDDNPKALTLERFMAAAHLAAPYQHPIVGWMNDLQHMKVTDLQRWYEQWYAPNNATLVVVGDVKPDAVYQLAKRYFAAIPAKPTPRYKPQQEPRSLGTRRVTVNAPAQLPLLLMGYNVPSAITTKNKQQAYALEVLSGILDGGNSSRLQRSLVRGTQIASEADVYYDLYSRYDGQFLLYAVPSKGHSINQLEKALLQQIDQLQQTLASPAELRRIKNQVIAARVYQQDSNFGQAMQIGLLETVGLSWKENDAYVEHIKAVTAEQVQQVAKEFLIPERLTIATLQPLVTKSTPTGRK